MTADLADPWQPVLDLIKWMGDEYRVIWSKSAPPSAAMIAAAEVEVGVGFAPAYRDFLGRFGALYVEVDEATWTRPAAYDIRPTWQMHYGRVVAGLAANIHPDLSVVARGQQLRARGGAGFVPVIGEMIGGDTWVGYDARGALVRWRKGEDTLDAVGGTLADQVLAALHGLVADRERLRTEPIA